MSGIPPVVSHFGRSPGRGAPLVQLSNPYPPTRHMAAFANAMKMVNITQVMHYPREAYTFLEKTQHPAGVLAFKAICTSAASVASTAGPLLLDVRVGQRSLERRLCWERS